MGSSDQNDETINLINRRDSKSSHRDTSNLEIEAELNLEPRDSSTVESPKLLTLYMCLAGFISHFPMFMMLSEIHTFDKKFKRYEFSFFVLVPTYICIPYSMMGNKLMASLSYTTQININKIFTIIFMSSIYVIYWWIPLQDEYHSKHQPFSLF